MLEYWDKRKSDSNTDVDFKEALNFWDILSISEDTKEDDDTFRNKAKGQISQRDEKYTDLLDHFVKITKWRNVLKEIFKWSFYVAIIVAMIIMAIIVYRLYSKLFSEADIDQIISSIPLLITSLVSFVSTIIAIPLTITKYLFSTKEDENITEIILHTQKHDTSGRKWAMDFKELEETLESTEQITEDAS